MVKKEYLSRKDLNSRETLAYEYMLDNNLELSYNKGIKKRTCW